MEALAAAATLGTVVELTVQLSASILKIQKAVNSIKSAPQEITDLRNDLDFFQALLKEVALVAQRQDESSLCPASPSVLHQALKICDAKLHRLHDRFAEYDDNCQKPRKSKTWARVTLPLTRARIEKARAHVQDAVNALQSAIATNNLNLSIISLVYYTIFGYVKGATVLREVFGETRSGGREPHTNRIVQAETTASFSPFFLSRVFYWRSISLHGSVERRWTVYSHDEQSVLWKLCETGDIAGVQQALSNGCSPHIVRRNTYENLLHVSSKSGHLELSQLLMRLQVGSYDASISPYAMTTSSAADFIIRHDLLRTYVDDDSIVLRSRHDLSWVVCCAADGLSIVWLDDELFRVELPCGIEEDDEEASYKTMLRTATVIPHAVDVISAAEQLLELFVSSRPAVLLRSTRLLEEVFRCSSEYEAEAQANRWLELLSRHGVDIETYLQSVVADHDVLQWPLLRDRRLLVRDGERKSLSWSWCWDLDEPALELLQEFQELALSPINYCGASRYWPYLEPCYPRDRLCGSASAEKSEENSSSSMNGTAKSRAGCQAHTQYQAGTYICGNSTGATGERLAGIYQKWEARNRISAQEWIME